MSVTRTAELRSAAWPGAIAALWAAAAGWLTTLAAVLLAGGGGSPLGTARVVTRIWLVAQGSAISIDGTRITLIPWGGLLVAVALVAAMAWRQVREPVAEPAAFAATVAGTYAVAASVLTALANDQGATVPTIRAALVTFVLGGVGGAAGYALAHGVPDAWWPQGRPQVRAVLAGAGWSAFGVFVAALVLVVAMIALHVERAASLWAMLDPGFGGGLGLALVCVLCVPTLALWAVAVLLGPGFGVGTDTSVDLMHANLGQLPGLPVLAALPAPGDIPGWAFLLALVPALSAGWAGWHLVRSGRLDLAVDFWWGVGLAAGAGGLGGVLLAVLAYASSGAVGPGRMAQVGPESLWALFAGVPMMVVAAGFAAAAAHYRGGRAPQA
ncbi:MAG: DUF6350 family protein [Aeromicrobium sp.]|uniref:cell division protein PerM n=1 Tax=Aeromicrobium sp. TaxID=1871063 RepID=UPI0039E6E909